MIRIQNYIGGELQDSVTGQFLENINPANGSIYSKIPNSGSEDVERAIEAAESAFPMWSELPEKKRGEWLLKIAEGLRKKSKEFAEAESRDSGKAIQLATTVDIPRAIQNFEYFSTAFYHLSGNTHPMDGKAVNYTTRKPLGVIGAISPWNLPLYLLTWKIAPAIAAGNTIVAKPSEVTPMTAYLFSKLLVELSFPPGVINIVHGTGPSVGAPICASPKTKAISFTGSTATGKTVASTAASMFKKVSLEMGGKNPNIVFADCDFEEAVSGSVRAAFSNNGQICLCGSRIYVERPIYEKFKEEFIKKANQLKIGDPLDESNDQGAIVSKNHYEKILKCIELAKEEGGKVLMGGSPFPVDGEHSKGFYISPTLIEGVSETSRTNQEEIFGPVATIAPFDTEREVIGFANGTDYGLSGSIWTQDISRGHRVASKIDSGILWVNSWMVRDLRTPFGGMKASGVGREGGEWAFDFYTETKNIHVKL